MEWRQLLATGHRGLTGAAGSLYRKQAEPFEKPLSYSARVMSLPLPRANGLPLFDLVEDPRKVALRHSSEAGEGIAIV